MGVCIDTISGRRISLTLLALCLQAPTLVARRVPVVCRAAETDAAEVVSVSDVENKEAVAHLRFQRGSVHKVRRGKATRPISFGTTSS